MSAQAALHRPGYLHRMKTLGDILWFLLSGAWMAIGWLFWAPLLAITIIGILFGRRCLELAVSRP